MIEAKERVFAARKSWYRFVFNRSGQWRCPELRVDPALTHQLILGVPLNFVGSLFDMPRPRGR
jgi:hypothetical protein